MNYIKIDRCSVSNGIGFRVVLWVSGCNHNCFNCHNQQVWDPSSGISFDEKAKQEIYELLTKPYIAGITYSGGDPLYPGNRLEIYNLAKSIRKDFPNKTQWLYTGYTLEQIVNEGSFHEETATESVSMEDIVRLCDVLVDGEYVDDKRDISLEWRGSSNQRVIDIKESMKQNKIVLWCE